MSTTTHCVALTIAGSDSGGGAGIQADLRTFTALGVFGTSAVTAVTSQNLEGVSDVVGLHAVNVASQVQAVLDGFKPRAVKTGMLWSADIVEQVAGFAAAGQLPNLVVDPVMVATSGARLLEPDAVTAYRSQLFKHATLITPNLDEAALLLGEPVGRDGMEDAAGSLREHCGCPVLLKGGHLEGDPVDLLLDDAGVHRFSNRRVHGINTHGSGCTLSAAITARLAKGADLPTACGDAIAFLQQCFHNAFELESGQRILGAPGGESEAEAIARGYGERLARPADIDAEPAHVYRLDRP